MINVSYPDYALEEASLKARGVNLRICTSSAEPELVASAQDAEAVVVALQPLTASVISSLKRCRVIGRLGVGIDSIDVQAATRAGIAVINVPDYCTEEVALHAVSLLLTLFRKISQADRLVRTGNWDRWQTLRPIPALSSRVLGIVGFGRIGQKVAEFMAPMVREIVAYDPHLNTSPIKSVRLVPLEELLQVSHLVTLHGALTDASYHLFDKRALSLMPKDAVLVNVSRGAMVCEDDLVEVLTAGKLAGVGLDVLEHEPPQSEHPLLKFQRVMLTNHIAWYSEASVVRQRTLMMQRILDYLDQRPVPSLVNPEVLSRQR